VKEEDLEAALEDALLTQVSARCVRAYRHDMRNTLQGVYGSIDALIRFARPANATTGAVPVDRTIEFAREAIKRHDGSLDGVIEKLVPGEEAAVDVDVSALLAELTVFLRNDAARHGVDIRTELAESLGVCARPSRLRLVFLGLMTDAIDAMPGGGHLQLTTKVRDSQVEIDIADSRAVDTAGDPWALDLSARPQRRGIVMHVTRSIVLALDGSIECEARSGGGRVVWMKLPRLG
jgi:signal transduction histidine kinase